MIIVASTNIFRRELASYLLAEAGYRVGEARDLPALLTLSEATEVRAVVVDVQLEAVELPAIRHAIRGVSAVPILWLIEPDQAATIAPAGSELAASPYAPGELVARLERLLQLADGPFKRERFVGAAE